MSASGLTCFSPRFPYPNYRNTSSKSFVIRVFSPDQKNGIFRRKLQLSFRPSDYSDKKYRPAFQHTTEFRWMPPSEIWLMIQMDVRRLAEEEARTLGGADLGEGAAQVPSNEDDPGPSAARPVRQGKIPKRYEDFIMG
ncbi:hypothetical protein ZOSMA_152G00220 [Zostera marina]|uniref:Uncharacterized protein n=1 Tax=Zostera marina TaxID=29655 RepID=A0A0K9PVX0_ZOSMR|nr:hypothetical protein ZOSMA_152G00220 [Zostera marina]